MGKLQRVLIMAGGTGGHVFPGLAIAKRLQSEGIEISWLGTPKGLEAKLIPETNIPLHFIEIQGVRGKGLKNILFAPWLLTYATWQACRIFQKIKPDVVIGMGGFVSGPGGIASWLMRIPLIIHEQNAKPGTTNKWLAKVAKKVLEGFPNTFLENAKVVTVGNPLRAEILELASPSPGLSDHHPMRLLVLGGSLGAQAINQLLPEALAKFSESERPEIYHQTGEKNFTDTVDAYRQLKIKATVVPFIKEIDKAYAWADIVLCRAGALTVSELCAAGLGAILIPFPQAVDDHQTANANFMVKRNAALLVQQSFLTVDKLVEILREFMGSPSRYQQMAQAAYELRRVDAADKVLKICEEICR